MTIASIILVMLKVLLVLIQNRNDPNRARDRAIMAVAEELSSDLEGFDEAVHKTHDTRVIAGYLLDLARRRLQSGSEGSAQH